MARHDRSDFEIGYDYVRRRYAFLAKNSPQYLWELGTAYFRVKGAIAELSRGMGCYFLELGMQAGEMPAIPAIPPKAASWSDCAAQQREQIRTMADHHWQKNSDGDNVIDKDDPY